MNSTSASFKKTYHNFYERQRFRHPWVNFILVLIWIILMYLGIVDVMNRKPIGLVSFYSSWIFLFTLMIYTPGLILIYFLKLETIINKDGIFYRWFPLRRKYSMIPWENIKEITLTETFGYLWLWRRSSQYKQIHYLGGSVGLLLKMKSGRKRLFGTRKAEELNHKLIRMAGEKYRDSDIGQDKDFSD